MCIEKELTTTHQNNIEERRLEYLSGVEESKKSIVMSFLFSVVFCFSLSQLLDTTITTTITLTTHSFFLAGEQDIYFLCRIFYVY
jgi:archaellum biogenesis protein FlaJ (TadC family)